jgi:hypothetical protein
MSRDEIQKLLGGYATGTLTAEEQQALFAAALEDQELFDALGREQSLRDLLRDPTARAHLLAALDAPAPAPWFRRWWMPLSAAAVAVTLASVAIVAVRRQPPAPAPVTVAKLEPLVTAPVSSVPPPAPAPAPARARVESHAPRAKAVVAPAKELARADIRQMAPAPPPPVAAGIPSAPKDAALKEKAEVAVSSGAQMVELQSTADSLGKAQGFRDLPVETRNAVTSGSVAELKKTAAPTDARVLFYGTSFAGGAGGGRGGAVGGIASGAAGIRPLAKTATAAPADHLGIQYRILRKTDSGEFVEADTAATGSVAAGTLFKLQITTNDGGYVRVLQEAPDGAWREIVNHAVERMLPIETEPIELDQPGRVKFYLAFSRQPLPQSNVTQPDDDIVVDRGRVVTVAGRDAPAQQLSFNITLIIQ